MESDRDLVRRAAAGESAAYAELVRRWTAPILAACRARVRTSHVAEDLTQETLLRGWASIGSLRDTDKFGAWLRGIAHRVCLDWLKSPHNREQPFSRLDAKCTLERRLQDEGPAPMDELESRGETELLYKLIDDLPDDEREVLLLYSSGEWTYARLAEFLGIAAGTVNARLSRAREHVRRRYRVRRESEV